MPGFCFSVPYNDDLETLKQVFQYKRVGNNTIREIFMAGPQEYSGSGRVTSELALDQFIGIVDQIHQEGLRVNLLFNSVCEGSDWYSPDVLARKMEYLRLAHKEHGVEAVTVANPILIREVRKRFPDLEICASVLSDIDSVQKALVFKECGANTITPDANINRNLPLLIEIKKATGVELKIMVNEGCLYRCPFRKFHFNYLSHLSLTAGKTEGGIRSFPAEGCLPMAAADPSQLLRSGWVRPEDLGRYEEVTSFFKIVGRASPRSRALRSLKAYMTESWDGDLLDIMDGCLRFFSQRYGAYIDNQKLGEFFQDVGSCAGGCGRCDHCGDLARKLLLLGWFTPEKLRDMNCEDLAERLERGDPALKASRHGTARMLLPHPVAEK